MSTEIKQHQPSLKPVTMTPAAIKHVQSEIKKHHADAEITGFRLYLSTAGCSGMMYKIEIVDHINSEDLCFPACTEFNIYIDKNAYPFVQGTEIDFVTEGLNQIFKYNNPNETASCGCGESFTIDDRFDDESEEEEEE